MPAGDEDLGDEMWNGQRVTVVFPAYNEEEGIARAVEDFGSVEYVDEVLVVDNNSSDRTAELAEQAGARVVTESKQGYGHALQRGMREARDADLVILAEPDGTFMGVDVPKLLVYSDDTELVLGTRTTREFIWQQANMGFALRWGNWAVAKVAQLLFGMPSLSDVGCTMRLIHREALDRIQHRFTVGGSHFLPEMVILARLAGVSIVEVPVKYRARLGTSKITGDYKTAVEVGWRMILLILGYRFRTRGQRSVYSERSHVSVS
jgi:glycosyltransferase involved in cell wall biosynthesis